MKFLATGKIILTITLCLAPGLLAAPTLESRTEKPKAGHGTAKTTEKQATTTTIAGVEVRLTPDGVPVLGAANGIDGTTPRAMSVYEAAGKRSYAAYNAAITAGAGSPDTKTTKDVSQIVKNRVFADAFDFSPAVYKATTISMAPPQDLLRSHAGLKLFTADQLGNFAFTKLAGLIPKVKVTNFEQDKGSTGQTSSTSVAGAPPIVEGIYDTNGYAQIAVNAFKAHDETPTTNAARLPVNELSWQTWASVAKTNIKNLEVIFLINIQNKGFWKIAAENYAEAGIPPTKAAVWAPTDAKHTVWFERLLGSDNINGKMIALTNHHNAIGNKKIARVVTIPRQAAQELGATGSSATEFTAALVLGS